VSRRRAVLFAAAVVLSAAATLGGLAHVVVRRSDRLLATAGRRLGRELRAERLGVSLRGGLGVALSGVQIADDPTFGAAEPFLAARRLEMRLRLLPLLRRRLVVDHVVIDEPVVNLVRDRSGRLNVDSLGPRAPAAEIAGPEGAARRPPAFQLVTLRLRQGTVRYQDRAAGRMLQLLEVALDAREPRFGAPVPVSLRARLAGGDLRLENILAEGVLDLAAERPAYRGTLQAGPGTLGSLALTRLEARVQASPPVLGLEAVTLELLGGTVTGSVRLAGGGEAPELAVEFDGRGLDLARLPELPGRPHPAGTLALRGAFSGPAPGAPDFPSALAGSGRFEVTQGRAAGLALGRALLEVLGPVVGAETAARLRERYPDLFADDLRFTRLSGSGRLAGGRIHSEDLALEGASFAAHGRGSLELDGDLDVDLQVVASPALTDDLLGRSRARPVLVDARGQLAVPLRVRGPIRHPRVTPAPEFAATVARTLLAGTGLGEAAGNVLERLLGARHRRAR